MQVCQLFCNIPQWSLSYQPYLLQIVAKYLVFDKMIFCHSIGFMAAKIRIFLICSKEKGIFLHNHLILLFS